MVEFCMPSLGADMEKGILVEWKVKPGDRVHRGDIIAEVETDKGIMEIEVFVDGVIETLLAEPDDEVPVGGVMALIRIEGEPADAEREPTPRTEATLEKPTAQAPQQPAAEAETAASSAHGGESRLKISPAARKKAAELGLEVTVLQGTGPDGAISLADVERASGAGKVEKKAVKQPAAAGGEETSFQLGMRRAIAAAMGRSKREIPHYYLETRIDVSIAMQWLAEENQRRSVRDRLLSVVLLLKATALALTEIPDLNGYWIEDRHQPGEAVHIGFAIALRQGGLIAPAIHDANRKSLDQLMAAMRDLIARTRSGKLRGSEMTNATVTLTNLGDLGVESSFGVIYPPQVALVSFGKIMEQPWAENGMIGIRPVLSATLSGDHRATDGRTGARFLNALDRILQEPGKL